MLNLVQDILLFVIYGLDDIKELCRLDFVQIATQLDHGDVVEPGFSEV